MNNRLIPLLSNFHLVLRVSKHMKTILSRRRLMGLVIVDQHAAHERLVYKKLESQLQAQGVAGQDLLIPEIIELSHEDCTLLLTHSNKLEELGLMIESFRAHSIEVRSRPALFGQTNVKELVLDVLDGLKDQDHTQLVHDKIEEVLSRMACYESVRSVRRLKGKEINALLRQMEATPHSGQCNHGRLTYVELKLADIERLFDWP